MRRVLYLNKKKLELKNMCNPTTGSPTITLCQLRPNYHTVLNPPVAYSLTPQVSYKN